MLLDSFQTAVEANIGQWKTVQKEREGVFEAVDGELPF